MSAVIAAGVSMAAASLVAVTGYSGQMFLAAAIGLMVLVMAIGWGPLLDLPDARGSALLVMATGAVGVAMALWAPDPDQPLGGFASVLAVSVIAAFVHEMVRRPNRPALLESVSGTLSGQVMALLAAGWLLLPQARLGAATLFVAAIAVACARAATALPWPVNVTGWVAFAAGAAGAALAGYTFGPIRLGPAIVMGLAVAAVVAAMDRLLVAQPSGHQGVGLLSASVAPVAAAGTVAYAAVRLLGC